MGMPAACLMIDGSTVSISAAFSYSSNANMSERQTTHPFNLQLTFVYLIRKRENDANFSSKIVYCNTTIPWRGGEYIPRRKRRGIYPPLFTNPEGDSCFSIYQIRWIKKKTLLQFVLLKLSRNDAPFFSPFAKQWIFNDIPSYRSQSKRAKIAIHWFGKY